MRAAAKLRPVANFALNRLDFAMLQLRRLTDCEFKLCFAEPMINVTNVVEPAADIWPYVENIDLDELALKSLGDVRYVYRDGMARYDQVLIDTDRSNTFVALVVDLAAKAVLGHFLLDFDEIYGMPARHQD